MNILFFLIALFFSLNANELVEVKVGNAQAVPDFSKSSKSDRKDFFKKIMSFDEKIIIDAWNNNNFDVYNNLLQKAFSVEKADKQETFFIRNSENQQKFKAGNFQEITIKKLREFKPNNQNGTFNIIAGYNTSGSSWFRNKLDIGAIQALPENRDAVFQVASNFSTLEPTGKSHFPEYGVTGYISDFTQGPFASISAAPGVIYRMYYIFYSPKTDPSNWRQTRNKQINLLDLVSKYYPCVNGYVDFSLADLKDSISSSEIEKIKIGYHHDIQVTYGFLLGSEQINIDDVSQTVNQVFFAAIDFGSNFIFINNKEVIKRAKIILDAAYEGTIKVAAINGKKKVYLTLMGGGVFDNDWSWIAESIAKNEEFIKKSGLDVTLFVYNLNKAIGDVNNFKKQMVSMANNCGGKFIIYKNDGIYELKLAKSMAEDLYDLQVKLNALSSK